jgi:glutamine---fructose-6-phosphate transaminase (isomerizing)
MDTIYSQRCTTCLMPVSYPGIRFDGQGVCNQCNHFVKRELKGESALLDIIRSARGLDYDCVVGISGGKDSCYVAYLAKEKYRLRTLAVCYDFPFLCDLARENVKNVCNALNIDLIVVKSRNSLEFNLLRNHLISLAATGTTWGQCLFCHYGIDAILYNEALEKKIPFLLGGVTKYELWELGSRTKLLLKRVKKLPFNDLLSFAYYQAKAYGGLVAQRLEFKLPSCNKFNVYSKAKRPLDGPLQVNVFDFVQWDQDLIEKTLTEKTGWEKPAKSISWRYDCILEPLLDLTYKKEFGISTVGVYLSNLIRDGRIARDVALKILEQSEQEDFLRQKLNDVFDFLDLPSHAREKFFLALKD